MKKIVSKTFNRLANAFKRPIVVEGQGAPIKANSEAFGDWDIPTVELDVSAFQRASKELWDGIERRRNVSDTVGQADNSSYGGDWDDVKTAEYVMVEGVWVRK